MGGILKRTTDKFVGGVSDIRRYQSSLVVVVTDTDCEESFFTVWSQTLSDSDNMSIKISYIMLFLVSSASAGGWSLLLGSQIWQAIKFTSSTGKFLREHVTHGKILGSALSTAISSLRLFGSLALFKELEQALDPVDLMERAALTGLIQQVNLRIQKEARNKSNTTISKTLGSGGVGDFS